MWLKIRKVKKNVKMKNETVPKKNLKGQAHGEKWGFFKKLSRSMRPKIGTIKKNFLKMKNEKRDF